MFYFINYKIIKEIGLNISSKKFFQIKFPLLLHKYRISY